MKKDNENFAKGICFYKIIWVFLVSALLGDFIETIFCRLVYGTWMSMLIEKLPAFQGKVITWIFIVFMICNALISVMAMVRYIKRQEGTEAKNAVEVFLDSNYEDDLIEKVWPNMVITK